MTVRSDHVNTTVTIPPGSALQDYLCSGPLQSNMNFELEDGEHRMSSQPSCNIANKGSVTITGSFNSAKRTLVRCQSKTRVLAFVSVQTLTVERITFINCGLQLVTIENTYIVHSAHFRAIVLALQKSKVDFSIIDCTFQNNSANGSGGVVMLYTSTSNLSITVGCVTFFYISKSIISTMRNSPIDFSGL